GNTGAVGAVVDECVTRIAGLLEGLPPTTTTTTVVSTSTTSTSQPAVVHVDGRVVSVAGTAVPGAAVSVGRTPIPVTADGEGSFSADAGFGEVTGDALHVRVRANGFADGMVKVPIDGSAPVLVTITLQPVAVDLTIEAPDTGIVAATADARLTIPGGVLPTSSPVRVEFTPLDPTTPEIAAYPGRDFLAGAA